MKAGNESLQNLRRKFSKVRNCAFDSMGTKSILMKLDVPVSSGIQHVVLFEVSPTLVYI